MRTLVGVASILEGPVLDEARRLWKLFETRYASTGVQSFDHPNLTFQGGLCSDVAALAGALRDACRRLAPFDLIVDGLGYFEAPAPTVFMAVQMTEELRHINRELNALLGRHCEQVFDYYAPAHWTPHVTVAMGDLTADSFEHARRDLHDYHPHFRQVLSNLQLVQRCDETGRIEIVESYRLDKPLEPCYTKL